MYVWVGVGVSPGTYVDTLQTSPTCMWASFVCILRRNCSGENFSPHSSRQQVNQMTRSASTRSSLLKRRKVEAHTCARLSLTSTLENCIDPGVHLCLCVQTPQVFLPVLTPTSSSKASVLLLRRPWMRTRALLCSASSPSFRWTTLHSASYRFIITKGTCSDDWHLFSHHLLS